MLNRVVLIGRMTRDPELRKTTSGLAVASFAIAVDDSYKQPDGTKNTLFMNCSIFGNKAENVAKFTRKGSLVAVEGRLNQRKYTRKTDNVQMTVIEVIADNVEFLDPKGASQASDASGYTADKATPAAPANQANEKKDSGNLDSIDVVDDDLPF
jgi:single-strand DNA-binding protein